MLNIYRVALIGHRIMTEPYEVERRLKQSIEDILYSHDCVEFYLGRNGEFDILAASVIKQLQNKHGHEKSAMILVLPYSVKAMKDYQQYYDDIILPISPTHPKRAITARNQWMVDSTDLLIAHVRQVSGGAWKCMTYAKTKQKEIINI